MSDLAIFNPTIWILGSITSVVVIVIAVQKYFESNMKSTVIKVAAIETELNKLTSDTRVNDAVNHEHWGEVKATMESVRAQLSGLVIGQVEMKISLFGQNGTNGVRGELKSLREDVKELQNRVTTIQINHGNKESE